MTHYSARHVVLVGVVSMAVLATLLITPFYIDAIRVGATRFSATDTLRSFVMVFGAPFLFVYRWWTVAPTRPDAIPFSGALFASFSMLLAVLGPYLRGDLGATAAFIGFSMWGLCIIGVASGFY